MRCALISACNMYMYVHDMMYMYVHVHMYMYVHVHMYMYITGSTYMYMYNCIKPSPSSKPDCTCTYMLQHPNWDA